MTLENAENITLVNDWDSQPKLGKNIGHHVTRAQEHSRLIDFLTRRNEGSLLLCGYRGIGKTSSIFGAVNESIQIRKNLIPILIKATSIHFEEGAEKKKSLLKRLVKSLHKKLLEDDSKVSKDIKSRSTELYKKSIASEIYDEDASNTTQAVETTSKSNFKLIPTIILIVSGLLFFIPELSSYSWLLSLIAVSSGVSLAYDYSRKTTNNVTTQSSHHYRRDYDFATLQSELEELLEELSKNNHKILFILDEFDKVAEPLTIVRDLKMLINQGNALFIFITVPEILQYLESKDQEGYTLFSEILFLKRPLFKEMESFIDEIVESSNDELKSNIQYKNLKNYLCYMSHTNFFELYGVIRNRMVTNEYKKPSLKLELNNNQITKANLQKSIGWVYENKQQDDPSQWKSNDEMLDILYDATKKLEDSPKLDNVAIDEKSINFPVGKINYTQKDRSTVLDLLLFLTRQGYLSKVNDNMFSIIGDLSKFHTDISGIFVEEQRIFLKAYDRFKENIVNFVNIKSYWVENLGTPYSVENFEAKWEDLHKKLIPYFDLNSYIDARTFYSELTSFTPPLIPADQLQAQTNNVRAVINSINTQSTNLLSEILTRNLKMNITVKISDISQGIFSGIGIPNQNLPNNTLQFKEQDKKIDRIAVVLSPQVDFLKDVISKNIPLNNVILCLGDNDQFQNYQRESFIINAITPFQTEIKEFSNLKEDEKKTIFFAVELPLQSEKIEKLIQVLKKSPVKMSNDD